MPKRTPAAVGATSQVTVEFPEPKLQTITIRVQGDTPLIMNHWSQKAKEIMRLTQMGGAKPKKAPKDPAACIDDATYFISRNPERIGFPALAFKKAIVTAALTFDAKKSQFSRAFHVLPDARLADGPMVEIFYKEKVGREDMVRVGMGSADLRYRPEFQEWWCNLKIRYDANQISANQLGFAVNQAGFSIGVGEWRVEKSGESGMFHVAETA
jgi:hypothetical protein